MNPQPTSDEIEEILSRLRVDLPYSGLDRTNLTYAFVGIRTLPLRKSKSSTLLSRKHKWHLHNRVLSLIGGKFTTADWTVREGLLLVYKYLGLDSKLIVEDIGKLPDAIEIDAAKSLVKSLTQLGLPSDMAINLVDRYGKRARRFLEIPEYRIKVTDELLFGEIIMAFFEEQAETIEDLLRRRTNVEYRRGHGLDSLDSLINLIKQLKPGGDFTSQARAYVSRLKALDDLLQTRCMQMSDNNLSNAIGL